MSDVTLETGEFLFNIKLPDGSLNTVSLDVLCLKLVCEECETTHNLQTTSDGRLLPTSDFLRDLASRLAELGVIDCTPSLAYQLWNVAGEKMHLLKKSSNSTQSSLSGTDSTPEA